MNNNPNKFHISYYDSNRKKSIETNNLDEVIKYVETEIDPSLSTDDEEIIIGVPTSGRNL